MHLITAFWDTSIQYASLNLRFNFLIKSLGSILKIYIDLFSPQIGAKRIHLVRTRGGNRKYRALRLETGNFSWGSECNVLLKLYFISVEEKD